MEMLMEYNQSQEQQVQQQIDQSQSEEILMFEQLHHTISKDLYE